MRATSYRRRILLPAVAGILALVPGCGTDEPPPAQSGAPFPPASVPPQSASTMSPTTSRPTSPALPMAADGSDLGACADADCTVQIRVGDAFPVDPDFGLDGITVSSIGDDEVTLEVTGTAGGLEAEGRDISINSSCVNGDCQDDGELTVTGTIDGRINDILLDLTGVEGDRAVLTLSVR